MGRNSLSGQYEVLNPWAEVDPIPPRGISPRLLDLNGRTIGFFATVHKAQARPILTVVERKLKERFPSLKFSWFLQETNVDIAETKDKARLEEWVKGIDAAVAALGD
jgi:hypothetical protein